MRLSIFLICLLFFVSCSSCVRSFPEMEHNGEDARKMMLQTVKIIGTADYVVLTKKSADIVSRHWTGSGVVMSRRLVDGKIKSVVLTADHVVSPTPITFVTRSDDKSKTQFIAMLKGMSVVVETVDGEICSAKLFRTDTKNDIATLDVDCDAGEATEIAHQLPPIGVFVTAVGSPFGFHPLGVFIVTDGRFVGISGEGESVVATMSASPGNSGGGIFYRGKLIAILTAKLERSDHVIFGTNLKHIKKLMDSTMEGLSTVLITPDGG